MMKLNGNTYLSYKEVTDIVDNQLSRFSTSQHAILPQDISYVDAELISHMKKRSKDIAIGLAFLYKTDEYIAVPVISNTFATFLFGSSSVSAETTFLMASYTESQKKTYREKYGNYLVNVLIGEVVKQFIKK
mgnify:CR=1 FL=1